MEKEKLQLDEEKLIKASGGYNVGDSCPSCGAKLVNLGYGVCCDACGLWKTH